MPFTIQRYSTLRPFLYHITARENISRIQLTKRFESTNYLLRQADRQDLTSTRRTENEIVIVGTKQIVIRNQGPLFKGNIEFAEGYTFEDLLESLNSRIYFWPGDEQKPISYGIRYFQRHQKENPIVFRVSFQALLDSNPLKTPLFCPYNSGSPRCSGGRKSPRGPDTFLSADLFPDPPGKVVETTFLDYVDLPENTECSDSIYGDWKPFFE